MKKYQIEVCNSISVSIWSKTDGQTAERASVRSIFRCSDVLNANTRIGSALAGQSEMRGGGRATSIFDRSVNPILARGFMPIKLLLPWLDVFRPTYGPDLAWCNLLQRRKA